MFCALIWQQFTILHETKIWLKYISTEWVFIWKLTTGISESVTEYFLLKWKFFGNVSNMHVYNRKFNFISRRANTKIWEDLVFDFYLLSSASWNVMCNSLRSFENVFRKVLEINRQCRFLKLTLHFFETKIFSHSSMVNRA